MRIVKAKWVASREGDSIAVVGHRLEVTVGADVLALLTTAEAGALVNEVTIKLDSPALLYKNIDYDSSKHPSPRG